MRKEIRRLLTAAAAAVLALAVLAGVEGPARAGYMSSLDVGTTWSVHPTGQPELLTTSSYQYVAYYDADRHLTVAQRKLGSSTWTRWRSGRVVTDWGTTNHKVIAMQIDRLGYLHVAANMHHQPMVYYRMTKPNTLSSMTRISWHDSEAQSVTYPSFLKNSNGDLFLTFRSGISGDGAQVIYNYSVRTKQWSRWVSRLFDGRSQHMSAYIGGGDGLGPVKGPDGWFHVAWVWRNSNNVATNHTVSYAKSQDLKNWYTASGAKLSLPITPTSATSNNSNKLVVDNSGINSGLFNGLTQVGFDDSDDPTVTYTKYDANGNSQIFTARYAGGAWGVTQDTNWTYRWNLNSINSVPVNISFDGVSQVSDGVLAIDYTHVRYGQGRVLLNASTMQPQNTATSATLARSWPEELTQPTVSSSLPMTVDFLADQGSPPSGLTWVLRWEHGPVNNDRPVSTSKPPAPTMLQVVRLNQTQQYWTSDDLALGRPVTTSSSYESSAWTASKAVDGKLLPGAGWSSDNNLTTDHQEWITVDLGDVRRLSQLTLFPGDAQGYSLPKSLIVQVSNDNANWTQVAAADYSSPVLGEQWLSLANVAGRYVRITGTSLRQNPNDANQYRMQFAEIGVYGSTDVAQGRPATASSALTKNAWSLPGLFNGVRTENVGGWSSNSSLKTQHSENVTVDLGSSQQIGRVALYPTNGGNYYPLNFTVDVSDDGATWRTVLSRTNEPIPSTYGDYGFPATQARYVRLNVTALRQWSGDHNYFRAQLAEFEVRQ